MILPIGSHLIILLLMLLEAAKTVLRTQRSSDVWEQCLKLEPSFIPAGNLGSQFPSAPEPPVWAAAGIGKRYIPDIPAATKKHSSRLKPGLG